MVVDQKKVRFESEKRRRRGGGLWRFRRNGRNDMKKKQQQQQQPPLEAEENVSILSNKNKKVNSPVEEEEEPELQSRTTVVHPRAKANTREISTTQKEQYLEQPPPARQAAFGGPVRYDWIDIETTAAIRVQAAYRRNKVMNDLERQGISTGAIRNRARRRHAEAQGSSFFYCCGTQLNFADFTEDDREAHRDYQKSMYEEQKKARFRHEEDLRSDFTKRQHIRDAQKNLVDEAFEVIE